MPEPRKPIIMERVSTGQLRKAVRKLALNRYPVRLAVIDAELQRRKQMQVSYPAQPGAQASAHGSRPSQLAGAMRRAA